MNLTSWLTALRIARREARRAKGRSALVIAMIGLPVLALAFGAASYDMFHLTAQEKATRALGAADAKISWTGDGPSDGDSGTGVVRTEDLLARLPAGSTVASIREGSVELRTASGEGELKAYGMDVANPMVAGIVALRDGRAPADGSEMALTEQASDRLGARVGDVVRNPDRTASWTVTGIVEFPGDLTEKVVFWPEWIPDRGSTFGYKINEWLWDAPAPVDRAQVRRLDKKGMTVVSRTALLDPAAGSSSADSSSDLGASSSADGQDIDVPVTFSAGAVVVGMAALEVVLLAGPAFAVGARRRRRELGLVAANGGTPAHLRRIVLADGVVLGALGAAAGLVLGVAAALAFRPMVELDFAHQRAGGYRVFPLALGAIAGLAVGTGVLAALVPAFTAARGDVAAALAGRQGVRRSRKRWLALGIALAGAGAATAAAGAWWISSYLVLAGLVLVELGLVVCTPTLVGLIARLGRVLPLAPRIGLRDAARNRAAAAPAIAAVMAAVAGSVAIGVVHTTDQARTDAEYQARLPLGHALVIYDTTYAPGIDPKTVKRLPTQRLVAAVRDTLPATEIATLGEVACPGALQSGDSGCTLAARMPQNRQCPYRTDSGEALTRAQQRAANDDPRCGTRPTGYANLVAGPAAVLPLIGASGDDLARARATLAAGGMIVDDPRFVVNGKVTLEIKDANTHGPETPETRARLRTISVPGYAPTTGMGQSRSDLAAGSVLISPAAVKAAKLGELPYGLAVATGRMPTQAEQDRLKAVLHDLAENGPVAIVEHGKPESPRDPTLLILAALAGLITLGAAGIGTGLAAADGRADLAILAAVGASPGVRRWLSLSQSGTIAGLGTVLGTIAGLGASTAVLFGYNQAGETHWPQSPPYPITVPWETLAVVLVVPLVAMLATGLLTRSRLPIERRRLT